jgi:hypothetical protein
MGKSVHAPLMYVLMAVRIRMRKTYPGGIMLYDSFLKPLDDSAI